MHISHLHRMLAATLSLFLLAGCNSTPKPVSHAAIKPPRWEYTSLRGMDSEQSPEAEKLKQAGWIFVGYRFSNGFGDDIAIDENSEAARSMYGTAPRDVVRSVFKREYQ
jgi:hypothetical protein